ncbi:Lysophospholipase L1 [Tangfeifania diversioriginum]|uniref:Lysophospholipase L1 n=1 Tax=Tangfeifania diversioriginum TaxID=1168035 RepID=A0A1M6MYB8_9BACT|nr:SGNH/GDSL hydrolase family protein [Tangfeifania diversioriginum]SHJ88439.1 Lysophospholipase L1 [Tangfeifania diversioriginum]
MIFKKLILFTIGCILFVFVNAQPTVNRFEKDERIVFVGNSITHGGHYHSFIWLYYMTRFPDQPIKIINAGIGGETAWDIMKRMEHDIFKRNPSSVVLTFGMNDTGYNIFLEKNAAELAEQQIKKSFESYQEIENRLQDAEGVDIIILGSSPYDETSTMNDFILPEKNEALLRINDFQQASAKKNGWGFIDFNRPMVKINQREQERDPAFSLCGVDRIHPDNDGQMVMAYLFLKAQGLAGKKVAEIGIDVLNPETVYTENCKVSNLKKSGNKLEFSYLANALPYPVDTVPRLGWGNKRSQRDALELVPFTKEFNQEILKVSNLEKGLYHLKIDQESIAEFPSEELESGINMALLTNTPQYQQALKIMFLNEERFEVEKRFRDYYWMEYSFFREKGLLFADNQEAMDTLKFHVPHDAFLRMSYDNFTKARYPEVRNVWQNYMNEIVKTIYEINTPVERKIELIRMD